MPWYAIGGLAVIGGIWTLLAASVLYVFVGGPAVPSYERIAAPRGSHVAIVGSKTEALDRLRAVWIAQEGADESTWHPVLRWMERDVLVDWQSDRYLIVRSRDEQPRTVSWQGVTIEIRRH